MKQLEKLLFLTYFQMRSKYRKTLAGFLWVIAYPIISFIVQAIVFDKILKLHITNYPAFLLAGLLPWVFISQSITSYASSLVQSREVLLTFKIHPFYIIGSYVLDNFFNYVVATLILLLALVIRGDMTFSLLQFGLFLVSGMVLLTFVFIITSLVSMLHVFYRDVQFVASFIMGLVFFVTPVFYNRQYLDQSFPWILKVNIFYPFIGLFQNSLYSADLMAWGSNLFFAFIVILLLSMLLLLTFNKKMKDFYINV